MDISDVCRILSANYAMSWYDLSHLEDVKQWLIDETLDRVSYNSSDESMIRLMDEALKCIIKKISMMKSMMEPYILKEVKETLEEIKKEDMKG